MREIIRLCEQLAPPSLAAEWDNIGLIVGDPREKASGVVVALDLTMEAIETAEQGAHNLIVVHHPPIFSPIRKIDLSTPQGALIGRAMKSGIAVYAMHTNLDSAPKGLNRYVAGLLGLASLRAVRAPGGIVYQVGHVPKPTGSMRFGLHVKKRLGVKSVRLYGGGLIKRAAVCTGAGADVLSHAAANGADALVTGDVRHHQAMECLGLGSVLVDAGHAGTERPMVTLVGGYLKKKMAKSSKKIRIVNLPVDESFENI